MNVPTSTARWRRSAEPASSAADPDRRRSAYPPPTPAPRSRPGARDLVTRPPAAVVDGVVPDFVGHEEVAHAGRLVRPPLSTVPEITVTESGQTNTFSYSRSIMSGWRRRRVKPSDEAAAPRLQTTSPSAVVAEPVRSSQVHERPRRRAAHRADLSRILRTRAGVEGAGSATTPDRARGSHRGRIGTAARRGQRGREHQRVWRDPRRVPARDLRPVGGAVPDWPGGNGRCRRRCRVEQKGRLVETASEDTFAQLSAIRTAADSGISGQRSCSRTDGREGEHG